MAFAELFDNRCHYLVANIGLVNDKQHFMLSVIVTNILLLS